MNLNSFVSDSGYGITNFIMLYLIGAFIRKYYDEIKINKLFLLGLYIIFSLIGTWIFYNYFNALNYNFIINVLNSIILFLLFKQIRISKKSYISKISDCSLAIYIIHENSFIRNYLYVNIFKESLFYNSSWLMVHQFVTCIGILLICLIIELIRKYIFKITVDKFVNKITVLNKVIEI